MIGKIKSGILSGICLIIINVLIGIILIPNFKLSNTQIQQALLQLPIFYFTLSLWLTLRFVLVSYFHIIDIKRIFNWLISTMSLSIVLSSLYIFIPSKELSYVIIVVSIILIINYLILFRSIYGMDKHDLEYVGDLHYYILALLVTIFVNFALTLLGKYSWHKNIDYIEYFIKGVPTLFLIRFLVHVKQDIEQNASA